jgi:hypothetical protein
METRLNTAVSPCLRFVCGPAQLVIATLFSTPGGAEDEFKSVRQNAKRVGFPHKRLTNSRIRHGMSTPSAFHHDEERQRPSKNQFLLSITKHRITLSRLIGDLFRISKLVHTVGLLTCSKNNNRERERARGLDHHQLTP